MPVRWHFKSVLWFFSAVIPGIGPHDMIPFLMWTFFPIGQVTGINLSAFSLFWQIPVLSTLSLRPAVHGIPPLGKNNSPVVSPYTLCNKYRHTCTRMAWHVYYLCCMLIITKVLTGIALLSQTAHMDSIKSFDIRADFYFYANALWLWKFLFSRPCLRICQNKNLLSILNIYLSYRMDPSIYWIAYWSVPPSPW